jgi:hypothetical protein
LNIDVFFKLQIQSGLESRADFVAIGCRGALYIGSNAAELSLILNLGGVYVDFDTFKNRIGVDARGNGCRRGVQHDYPPR